MPRGWWSITYTAVDAEFVEPNDCDLEHIAKCIQEGYTAGEINQEEPEDAGG